MIARDERLRAVSLLLVPAFVGHAIQLLAEDVPWEPWARLRYYYTPGWHLLLPPEVPVAIGVALAVALIGVAVRRTRPWVLAVVVLYATHYLTYPYRIRNHMTHMLAELTMLGGVWALGWLSGAVDLRGRGRHALRVDRWAASGMAVVLCITYFFAALHKVNRNFVALDASRSAAVEGLTTFWISGGLGSEPPVWAMAVAVWGTIVIEAAAPILAWRSTRLRVPMILTLFVFHFPHVSAMNVADYPMIASAFYPALFSRAHFRLLLRHARRPSAYTVTGAVVGACAQIWFMPWLGKLTGFGIFVMALWGWAAGAMIRMLAHGAHRRARGAASARPAAVG